MNNSVQTFVDCPIHASQLPVVPPSKKLSAPKPPPLPATDNKRGDIKRLLRVNAFYRQHAWPTPFHATTHRLLVQDARSLREVPDNSVHLIVTSPPYWNLKKYNHRDQQLGDVAEYEEFLALLDDAWRECFRVLVPMGRVCCVVGDVCVPRRVAGRHYVAPLHADIQVRSRRFGFDCLTPIFWGKIANATLEAEGNGAGFLGKPYQPGAIIKNDTEYILFLRKPGEYRSPSMLQKALSMMTEEEMKAWLVSNWDDIKGASTRGGHPAPFPAELAERLIRLFSYAGDVVLDPFAGTGSTAVAAIRSGRSSIGSDIDPAYVAMALTRAGAEITKTNGKGIIHATMLP